MRFPLDPVGFDFGKNRLIAGFTIDARHAGVTGSCPRVCGGVGHATDGFDIGVCPAAQVCHRFLRVPARRQSVGVAVVIAVTAAHTGVAGVALQGRGRRNDLVREAMPQSRGVIVPIGLAADAGVLRIATLCAGRRNNITNL